MTYPDYPSTGSLPLAGSTAADTAATVAPRAQVEGYDDRTNYVDADRDNGLPDGPAQYEGPAVADQPALVNPSAGDTGPSWTPVNPQGPGPNMSTGATGGPQAPDNPQQSGTGYTR